MLALLLSKNIRLRNDKFGFPVWFILFFIFIIVVSMKVAIVAATHTSRLLDYSFHHYPIATFACIVGMLIASIIIFFKVARR